MQDPLKPAPQRMVRAGWVVAAIILFVLCLGFVGRNLGHVQESKHPETSDAATHQGQ